MSKRRARAVILGILVLLPVTSTAGVQPPEPPTFVDYLRKSAVPRGVIDRFLHGPSWARFDPELGYVLGNFLPTDGIDGSATISTARPDARGWTRVGPVAGLVACPRR